jgi:hypothetical protein
MAAPLTLLISLAADVNRSSDDYAAPQRLACRPIDDLHRELRACEQRLGTAEECPADFERARTLAHEINNRATIEYLRAMAGAERTSTRLVA